MRSSSYATQASANQIPLLLDHADIDFDSPFYADDYYPPSKNVTDTAERESLIEFENWRTEFYSFKGQQSFRTRRFA